MHQRWDTQSISWGPGCVGFLAPLRSLLGSPCWWCGPQTSLQFSPVFSFWTCLLAKRLPAKNGFLFETTLHDMRECCCSQGPGFDHYPLRTAEGYSCATIDNMYCPGSKTMDFLSAPGFAFQGCVCKADICWNMGHVLYRSHVCHVSIMSAQVGCVDHPLSISWISLFNGARVWIVGVAGKIHVHEILCKHMGGPPSGICEGWKSNHISDS